MRKTKTCCSALLASVLAVAGLSAMQSSLAADDGANVQLAQTYQRNPVPPTDTNETNPPGGATASGSTTTTPEGATAGSTPGTVAPGTPTGPSDTSGSSSTRGGCPAGSTMTSTGCVPVTGPGSAPMTR